MSTCFAWWQQIFLSKSRRRKRRRNVWSRMKREWLKVRADDRERHSENERGAPWWTFWCNNHTACLAKVYPAFFLRKREKQNKSLSLSCSLSALSSLNYVARYVEGNLTTTKIWLLPPAAWRDFDVSSAGEICEPPNAEASAGKEVVVILFPTRKEPNRHCPPQEQWAPTRIHKDGSAFDSLWRTSAGWWSLLGTSSPATALLLDSHE